MRSPGGRSCLLSALLAVSYLPWFDPTIPPSRYTSKNPTRECGMPTDWRSWRNWLIGGPCAMALLGGATVFAAADEPLPQPPAEEEAEARAAAPPLTLEQLIILACEHNPAIAMAQTRVQAARGRLVQAGLYLNPSIIWEAEDMGGPGPHAAGAQGPIFGQDIVTAGK